MIQRLPYLNKLLLDDKKINCNVIKLNCSQNTNYWIKPRTFNNEMLKKLYLVQYLFQYNLRRFTIMFTTKIDNFLWLDLPTRLKNCIIFILDFDLQKFGIGYCSQFCIWRDLLTVGSQWIWSISRARISTLWTKFNATFDIRWK